MTDEPSPKPTSPRRPRRRGPAPEEASPPPAPGSPPVPEAAGRDVPAPVVAALAEPASIEPASVAPPAAPTTGARDIVTVERLEFERGAIGGVRAADVSARQAAIGGIAANQVSIEAGVVSGIAAREITVRRGIVRSVLAQNAHVEQALVRSLVANRVETGPRTAIIVAVARQIDGEARVLVDWRGGLALGIGLGSFLALIRLARFRRS